MSYAYQMSAMFNLQTDLSKLLISYFDRSFETGE
ncbi:hypothetical protein DJFAAGMI_04411 [Comamonas sp. PE63]|uniref:Uncharacterized protein n=1 Tax=Comamonas brasiliensis TaxID=1812482 RepID=A0ABS5M041_9BURK|nr:hypothetical protein [Comamonas sp. PE63]